MTFEIFLLSGLLSIFPLSELRGGLPVAVLNGMDPVIAYLFCVMLNLLVSPAAFLFMNTLHKILLRFTWYKNISEKLLNRARKKVEQGVSKFGYIGLTLFVSIPLPFTGAYTGTLGAWVLGMDPKKSIIAVSIGVMIAGGLIMLFMWLASLGYGFAEFFFQNQQGSHG
ncbi:MAG: small multi-drug export protein [Spirochaetales bacterium]|nr:small multi-drug export protein [Spirochaetales bacterium]